MPKISNDRPADIGSDAMDDGEQFARQEAVKQARARRLFKISTASAAVGVTLLVPIWAVKEYRNAGGWPTRGFSQRSGAPGVWEHVDHLPFSRLRVDYRWARLVGLRAQADSRQRGRAGDQCWRLNVRAR